jgi:aromatic aminotransferase
MLSWVGTGRVPFFSGQNINNCSDDFEVVRWLENKHGVAVVPGSSCGGPGCIRVSFGGLKEEDTRLAGERLRRGLQELVTKGMVQ